MNFSAGMDIEFQRSLSLNCSIESLLQAGWTYDLNGMILFLPIGSHTRHEWEQMPTEQWPLALQVMQTKALDGCANRIVLTYIGTPYAAAFEFFDDGDITVDFSDARPLIGSRCALTDVNWYIEHIVLPLEAQGAVLERVCYSEVRMSAEKRTLNLPNRDSVAHVTSIAAPLYRDSIARGIASS